MEQKKTLNEIINPPSGAGGISPSGAGGGEVYFIGIGGIGMSALARYFKSKGCTVSGYDKTSTALTRQLEQKASPFIMKTTRR